MEPLATGDDTGATAGATASTTGATDGKYTGAVNKTDTGDTRSD